MSTKFSPQDAMVAAMVAISASDSAIHTAELLRIQSIINHLPLFSDYDIDRIQGVSRTIYEIMGQDDGIDTLIQMLRDSLPGRLNETAYALACDVAAADGLLGQEELLLLQEMRHELDIDRLSAAAIERGAQARHRTL